MSVPVGMLILESKQQNGNVGFTLSVPLVVYQGVSAGKWCTDAAHSLFAALGEVKIAVVEYSRLEKGRALARGFYIPHPVTT